MALLHPATWPWLQGVDGYCQIVDQGPLAVAAGVSRRKWHEEYNVTAQVVRKVADLARGKDALRRIVEYMATMPQSSAEHRVAAGRPPAHAASSARSSACLAQSLHVEQKRRQFWGSSGADSLSARYAAAAAHPPAIRNNAVSAASAAKQIAYRFWQLFGSASVRDPIMTDLLTTNQAVTGDAASSAELSKKTRRGHKLMPQLVEEATELQRWKGTLQPNGDAFWHRNFASPALPFAAITAPSTWVWDLARVAYCEVLNQGPLARAAGVKRPKWHAKYGLTTNHVYKSADISRAKPAFRRLVAHIGEDARLAASSNPPAKSERLSRWPSLGADSINAKYAANPLDMLKSVRTAGIYLGEGRLNGVLHVLYTGESGDPDRRGVEHLLEAVVTGVPPSRTDSAWHQLARECTTLDIVPMFEFSVQNDEGNGSSASGSGSSLAHDTPALEVQNAVLEGVTSLATALNTLDEAIMRLRVLVLVFLVLESRAVVSQGALSLRDVKAAPMDWQGKRYASGKSSLQHVGGATSCWRRMPRSSCNW